MLMSMTGFGAGIVQNEKCTVQVEIKAVNSRYLDVSLRMPPSLIAIEDTLRKVVEGKLARGRVEIFVNMEEFVSRDRTVKLDEGLLAAYVEAICKSKKLVGSIPFTLEALLAIPGVFTVVEAPTDPEEVVPVIKEALHIAIDNLIAMRQAEGERLWADIAPRMARIESLLKSVQARRSVVVDEYRERLADRINVLLDSPPVDEARLTTEIAIFADKSCISEECVRATTHVSHFIATCQSSGSVGRKLDFILQELHRETSTLAVKSNDSIIAKLAIDIKAEIERVREQVQNIE